MIVSSITLAGTNAKALKIAQKAATLAFPQAVVIIFKSVDEVLKAKDDSQLLVLTEPVASEITALQNTVGELGLCKWPVIVLGKPVKRNSFTTLEEIEWEPHLMARVFKSAVEQHDMRLENLRLRNDLLTIVTRVNHDLRRAVGGIVLTGELVKSILQEKIPSEVSTTNGILDSAKELQQTLDTVFIVLKASASPPAINPVSMGEIVRATLQRLEEEIANSGALVKQPAQWPKVRGMSPWLETIWWNLIKNALDHSGPSPRIELGWQKEEFEYQFWVKDSGTGPSAKRVEQLFRPFHLLHQTELPGLGLSIVHRLVELQKGGCGYEKSADGTSRFFFTLPIDS